MVPEFPVFKPFAVFTHVVAAGIAACGNMDKTGAAVSPVLVVTPGCGSPYSESAA
jgi:hypothetical protein